MIYSSVGSALALLGWGASSAAAFGFNRGHPADAMLAGPATPASRRNRGPLTDPSVHYRQAMVNSHDLQYFAKLKMGTQEVDAVLDSGSVEFVVVSDRCEYWCGPEARLFHATKSASYVAGSLNLILSYGSGELLGVEAYDNVSVGPWFMEETAFWQVYDASMPLLIQSEWAAIIGLGPMPPQTQVMERGSRNKKHAYAVLPKKFGIDRFGICLGKEPGSVGYITWNDQTPEMIPGDFVKLSVMDSGYWMLKLHDVYLGDKYIACQRGCGVVADSGTSLLSMPVASYNTLKEKIGELHPDCNRMNALPDLHFTLDGQRFSLPPDAYVGNVYGSSIKAMGEGRSSEIPQMKSRMALGEGNREAPTKDQMSCEPAIMHIAMDSSFGPVWILGMPFFRKYYSVFVQPQREKGLGPSFYVATATNDCNTANGASLQSGLLGGSSNAREREHELMNGSWAHGHIAREVDMSKVQMPAWVHRASKLGRLEEVLKQPRVVGTPEEVGQAWKHHRETMAT